MKKKILLCGAFLTCLFFVSCDSTEKLQDESSVSNDDVTVNSKIDASIDDVENIAEDQFLIKQNATAKTTGNGSNLLPTCATVNGALTEGVWNITIDFGTQGCTLKNGNAVKGKIIVTFSSNFVNSTQTITYRFDGFHHNNKLLQGTKTIVRALKSTELLATLHPVSTHTIDMTITFPDEKVYTVKGERIKELIEGYETKLSWTDNVYVITGHSTVTDSNGHSRTNTITSPLRFVMSCLKAFPVKGTVAIVKNGVEAIVDFGNGECDDIATIKILGVTKEFHLEK